MLKINLIPQTTKILIGVVLLLISALVLSFKINSSQIKEINRLENNFRQTQINNQQQVGQLLITQFEMKEYYEKELDLFKDSLKLKPKEIVRWKEVKGSSTIDTLIDVKYDTIYTLPIIEFNDSCLVINAIPIDSSRYKLDIVNNQHSYDTYFRKRPKKFLFIKFGKWEYFSSTLYLCPKDMVIEKQIDIKIKR